MSAAMLKPIPFRAPMVQAILEGRKTQTRRVMRPQPPSIAGLYYMVMQETGRWTPYMPPGEPAGLPQMICPYGRPGDRLWVKERIEFVGPAQLREVFDLPMLARYAADGTTFRIATWPWKCDFLPPRFMPRAWARIILEITEVRVERVQEITREDAVAEGVTPTAEDCWSYTAAFERLWNSINAKRGFGWSANPWVWVIGFKRMEP